jgi:hypothetical protein
MSSARSFTVRITMTRTAKKISAGGYALASGDMHTAMRTAHHILYNRRILPGNFLAVRPEQPVNSAPDRNQH